MILNDAVIVAKQLARKAARMWNAKANTLLLLLVAAAQTTQSNSSSSTSSEHVPPLPLNISKHTTTTNDETTTSNINKVPTSIAGGPAVGFMPLQQTPASIFFINYNQQNVVQLRNNLEANLHSIRKFEMLVAKIQVNRQGDINYIPTAIMSSFCYRKYLTP